MLFIIQAFDKKDSFEIRQQTRPDHIKYLKDAGDRLKLAGPILGGDNGDLPVGTLLVIDGASEGAVRLFAEHDPYNKAGLFERVEIWPFDARIVQW